MNAYQIRPGELLKPPPTERNERYGAYIRMFPCIVCHYRYNIEAAHFGPHGTGLKASDKDRLPLCRRCHRVGPHSYHALGPKGFARRYSLNVWMLIAVFQRYWEERLEGLQRALRAEDIEGIEEFRRRFL